MVLNRLGTWVLLRGLTRESGHWGRFVDQFQATHPQCRVITLDIPGNGALFQSASPTTIAAMVAPCRAQLQALKLAPPYQLLALSMGGMVALSWAAQYPQELAACVLVNSSTQPFSPFHQRLQARNYSRLLKLLVSAADEQQWEQAIWQMTTNHSQPSLVADCTDLRRLHPVSRRNMLRQLWAAFRFRAPASISVPGLVLTSEGDRLVSPNCSRAIAAHYHWPLHIHPDAGHDLPQDDGAWVAQMVRTWQAGMPLHGPAA